MGDWHRARRYGAGRCNSYSGYDPPNTGSYVRRHCPEGVRGGSVNGKNAAEFFSMEIDGAP
jgi:hypothetical protein